MIQLFCFAQPTRRVAGAPHPHLSPFPVSMCHNLSPQPRLLAPFPTPIPLPQRLPHPPAPEDPLSQNTTTLIFPSHLISSHFSFSLPFFSSSSPILYAPTLPITIRNRTLLSFFLHSLELICFHSITIQVTLLPQSATTIHQRQLLDVNCVDSR